MTDGCTTDEALRARRERDHRLATALGPEAGYYLGRFVLGAPMIFWLVGPDRAEELALSGRGWLGALANYGLGIVFAAIGAVLALVWGHVLFMAAHAVWRKFFPVK